MKILQINKFFYPRGGAETYFFALSDLLKKNGCEVIFFAQKNPRNLPCAQEKYFLPDLELGKFSWSALLRLGRMFWSFKAARQIKKIILAEKPDLVHIHNIYHQISPSILPAIKKLGLPIVMTAHDFKLINPNYTLRADERRAGGYASDLANRAVSRKKNQRKKSWPAPLIDLIKRTILTLEFAFHQWLKVYQKNIDIFIAPSNFVRDQLVEHGLTPNKILVLPHFTDFNRSDRTMTKNFAVYFGRLDESKGVDDLIKSLTLTKSKISLKIIGAGPAETELKKSAQTLGGKNKVKFLGQKNRSELIKIISQSRFTVFPSHVHETFGLGIIESYALAKPVIATKVGAFNELVQEGQTGFLIEAGQPKQLALAIDNLALAPEKSLAMGINAKKLARDLYSPEKHGQKIMALYKSLISG